jgi:hypothetical protein
MILPQCPLLILLVSMQYFRLAKSKVFDLHDRLPSLIRGGPTVIGETLDVRPGHLHDDTDNR